ncbi:MAG: HD domain-containing protein [Nitrospirae bacterium]|nr:HD domain-containing protein [Nitrospirota bacterium]
MTKEDLSRLKVWFSSFCRSYYSENTEDQKNIDLKENHTFNVCKKTIALTSSLGLDENRSLIAEAAALFHDIGRFPQYAEYKTFRDGISINHGLLGAETLIKNNALSGLPKIEQNWITTAVKFHNAYMLADINDPEALFYLKLVRDADKLDIWGLFHLYYITSKDERPSAVGLGFPEGPEYSQALIECILNRQLAKLADLKTLNDFKLLQLTWVFDLNFKPSFKMFVEGGYLEKIVSTLPQNDDIEKMHSALNKFIKEKLET